MAAALPASSVAGDLDSILTMFSQPSDSGPAPDSLLIDDTFGKPPRGGLYRSVFDSVSQPRTPPAVPPWMSSLIGFAGQQQNRNPYLPPGVF